MRSSKFFFGLLLLTAAFCGCQRGGESRASDDQELTSGGEIAIEEIDAPEADQAPTVSDSVVVPSDHQAAKRVVEILNRSGSIRFDSQQVESQDQLSQSIRLTLFVDGVVKLVFDNDEEGVSVGEYAIDKDCRLQIYLGPDDPWPPMPIAASEEGLMIHPPGRDDVIQALVDAGLKREEITDQDIVSTYEGWPLQSSQVSN